MKPSELSPLVGRKVEAIFNGQRTAIVRRVAGGEMLSLQFAHERRPRLLGIEFVVGVHWRGRRRTVAEYLDARTRESSRRKGEAESQARQFVKNARRRKAASSTPSTQEQGPLP